MAIQHTTTDCGCTITVYGDGSAPSEIEYCDLHDAAEVLLAACKRAAIWINTACLLGDFAPEGQAVHGELRAASDKALGISPEVAAEWDRLTAPNAPPPLDADDAAQQGWEREQRPERGISGPYMPTAGF